MTRYLIKFKEGEIKIYDAKVISYSELWQKYPEAIDITRIAK